MTPNHKNINAKRNANGKEMDQSGASNNSKHERRITKYLSLYSGRQPLYNYPAKDRKLSPARELWIIKTWDR